MSDQSTASIAIPLCVDLDGTLVKTDMTWESLFALVKSNPLYVFLLIPWLLRGRAYFKDQIARRVQLDVAILPYNQHVVDLLKKRKAEGRELVLATASDRKFAQAIADHLQLFGKEIFASEGQTNLKGRAKAQALVARYGTRGYDYAGNSSADLVVWASAREAIVVNASPRLVENAARVTRVSTVIGEGAPLLPIALKAGRLHQWSKNLLVLVPVVAAHELMNAPILGQAGLAFLALSLCASGVYLLNDCFDLDADRRHPRKRHRPVASGELSIPVALFAGGVCMGSGALLAGIISLEFLGILGLYLAVTTGYSLYLKRLVLIDAIVLAQLYAVRVYAGGVATNIVPSQWLLTFSLFIFLSLALMKRFTELRLTSQGDSEQARVRGYWVGDLELLASLGSASGLVAVLVMALYLNSREVTVLYSTPPLLGLICPLVLYWISRAWLLAYRNQMDEDPVVFAVRDPISYALSFMVGAILILAK